MIILSLNDLRNVPAVVWNWKWNSFRFHNKEFISQRYGDVIIKGRVLVRNNKLLTDDPSLLRKRSEEISSRIYSEENILNTKKKYLMRGRVDKLESEAQNKEFKEIFVDMNITDSEYTWGRGIYYFKNKGRRIWTSPREKQILMNQVTLKKSVLLKMIWIPWWKKESQNIKKIHSALEELKEK